MARKGLKIQLGPYVFRQRWLPKKHLDSMQAHAYCDLDSRVIALEDCLDHPRSVENLMHELVEAINDLWDLRLPHWKIQVLGMALGQALLPLIKRWY